MLEIMNITDDPFQKHTVVSPVAPITLELRFYPRAQFWTLSIKYLEKVINGLKLSNGVLHCRSHNLPFDFIVVDKSNTGIDAFKADDFSSGRLRLIMLEREDMELIRGQPIPTT